MPRGSRSAVIALLVLSCAALIPCFGETVVLPVVARGVQGLNGSVWDSEVRISAPNLLPPGRVTRLWVALPEGGFVDDPTAAPQWVYPTLTFPAGIPIPLGVTLLTGDDLLQGTNAPKGAVALEIDGTGNLAFLHNANTLGQPRLPQDAQGPPCCLPGSGQAVRALTEPLVRRGFIPWVTSGRSPFRVSVGVINPTSGPRTISVHLHNFQSLAGVQPAGAYWVAPGFSDGSAELSVTVALPPWGFRQIDDFVSVILQQRPGLEPLDRVGPAGIYLVDQQNPQSPFYAYASVIWSPLNDPEFVAAMAVAQ